MEKSEEWTEIRSFKEKAGKVKICSGDLKLCRLTGMMVNLVNDVVVNETRLFLLFE